MHSKQIRPIFLQVHFLTFTLCALTHSLAIAIEPETQVTPRISDDSQHLSGQAFLGWESRYFSEGRDDLDGSSLAISSFELSSEHFSGGVWYGISPDQSYDELQLSLAWIHTVGDFEFYTSYTYLEFPTDNDNDHEIGIGAVWSGLPYDLELAVDAYYSFDADGTFIETSASRDLVTTDKFSLNLGTVFGINQGFVSDGHDGGNHIALRCAMSYSYSTSILLTAHVTQSWELGSDNSLEGDASLVDLFHAGVGIVWTF